MSHGRLVRSQLRGRNSPLVNITDALEENIARLERQVLQVVGGGILREKPPVDVGDGDSGPFSMTAKHEILKYALDSFAISGARSSASTTPMCCGKDSLIGPGFLYQL